jgi:hypothetical protein
MARTLLASVAAILIATPAIAQPTPPDKKDEPPPTGEGGTSVDLPEDDTPSEDPTGVNENPDKPTGPTVGIDTTTEIKPEPEPEPKEYPIEEVLRPITLPALMSEAGLDVRNNIKPYAGNTTLRGRFGITKKIQIGLEYNIGGFFDDANPSSDKIKFNTGKSIGLDVTYSVFKWMGIRLALPFYLDPFAMGATIGVPLKFRLGKTFAFGGGADFLSFKIAKFLPSTTDERVNDLNASFVDSGTGTSDGALMFSGFALFQAKPNIVVGGDISLRYEDFSDTNTPLSLRARAQYSVSRKLDFGGAFGFGDVAEWRDTTLLNLYAQLRI